jgi:hypothetical protein
MSDSSFRIPCVFGYAVRRSAVHGNNLLKKLEIERTHIFDITTVLLLLKLVMAYYRSVMHRPDKYKIFFSGGKKINVPKG